LRVFWWTRRQLREATSWSDRQIRQALEQLAEFEFLLIKGGGTGRTTFYRLADPPETTLVTTNHLVTSPQPRHHDRRGSADDATSRAPISSLAAVAAETPTSSPCREDKRNGCALAAS